MIKIEKKKNTFNLFIHFGVNNLKSEFLNMPEHLSTIKAEFPTFRNHCPKHFNERGEGGGVPM